MLYHYKLGLSQVKARLVEFKNQEIKFCKKIRGLEFSVESKNNRIERLTKELEELKKEKEGLDTKLIGFQSASKDLDNLLGSHRNDKNKEGLGYSVVPPPPAQVYSPPKKDMSWAGLPEFADDTITYYSEKGRSCPKNNNTYKSMQPRHAIHRVDRSSLRTNRPNMNAAKPKCNSLNYIDDKGYWDSGCSRHMTGNISYLLMEDMCHLVKEGARLLEKEQLKPLWALVKETLDIRQATCDKEKELWVELKRLLEPDVEDQLDQEIFMLVERDYPLRKGIAIVMRSNKLQVENYSQMANDLILKIHQIANSPRQRGD
nr:hypothetical protein [Tanacetum cinerariifolium]